MKIYILWCGHHQHQDVVGVFDTLEKAKTMAEQDDCSLKMERDIKWETDEESDEWHFGTGHRGYWIRKVKMNKSI